MKIAFFTIILCSLFSCKPASEKTTDAVDNALAKIGTDYTFYVGTYTNVKPVSDGGSEGIYRYTIDGNGQLASDGLVAAADNPSYLARANEGAHLIAVSEVDSNGGNGSVHSYAVQGDKTLERISSQSSGGAHPCHVVANDQGQVLVSNYTGGNVALLSIDANGQLAGPLDVEQHVGKGTHERQDAPHAHSAWFRPDDRGVISADLGTNELWLSHITDGKLVPAETPKLAMADGAGPRHIAFHPNGRWIYVVNELNNTVGIVDVAVDGTLTLGDTYATLPVEFTEFSKTADIHISADGRHVYASNRGHNSLAIYAVDGASGRLALSAIQSVRGEEPRNFQLTPDDRYVVVANQNSNTLVAFARDQTDGTLVYVSEIAAPAPVCILFASF